MKEEIDALLRNLASEIIDLTPRLILAIIIVLIGYLLGRLAEKLARRFILYLNGTINQQFQKVQLRVDLGRSAAFISKTLFWIILIISFLICVQVLRLDFLQAWMEELGRFLPNVLVAVIIVFVGIISGRFLGDLTKSAAARTKLANAPFLGRFVRYLVLFVAVVMAVDQLGVDVAFLKDLSVIILASLLFGASLAFGIGARTSVSNILGSYYVRKSQTLGNTIKVGEIEGIIVKITDHAVTLQTKTGQVVIPAKDFSENKVTILED